MCGGNGGTPPIPGQDSIDLPAGTHTMDLSGGQKLTINSPVAITCDLSPNPSTYPSGSKVSPVEITGTLGPGQIATITFENPNGFGPNDCVSFVSGGQWVTVASTLGAGGKTISATVDHFSIWSVIYVAETMTIEGDVTLNLGADFYSSYSITGNLHVGLLQEAFDEELLEEWEGFLYSDDTTVSGDNDYQFSIDDVPSGVYILYAFLDMDGDGGPAFDEPQNVYKDEKSSVVTIEDGIDLNITIGTFDISGTVTVDPPSSERKYVGLFTGPGEEARYCGDPVPANGSYTYQNIPYGWYFVLGFIDRDSTGDGYEKLEMEDGEPFGIWKGNIDNEEYIFAFFPDHVDDPDSVNIDIDTIDYETDIEITSPYDGQIVTQTPLTIEGSVSDMNGLDSLEDATVYVEEDPSVNASIDEVDESDQYSGTWSVELNLNKLTDGEYTIVVEVEDSFGLSFSEEVDIILEWSAPPPLPIEIQGDMYFDDCVDTGTCIVYLLDESYDEVQSDEFSYVGKASEPYQYSFLDVIPGSYLIFAIVDLDSNNEYTAGEPYGGTFDGEGNPQLSMYEDSISLAQDITITCPPETIVLEGEVSVTGWEGTHTDLPLYIGLYDVEPDQINETTVPVSSLSKLYEGNSVSYSFSGVLPGEYYIGAFLDKNSNFTWDPYEPYGGTPSLYNYMESTQDIDFNITCITIGGDITIDTSPSGNLYVGLYTDPAVGDDPDVGQIFDDYSSLVQYSFKNIAIGGYFIGAFIDLNGNDGYDEGEPFGGYPIGADGPELFDYTESDPIVNFTVPTT
jgi:hypothetical protein